MLKKYYTKSSIHGNIDFLFGIELFLRKHEVSKKSCLCKFTSLKKTISTANIRCSLVQIMIIIDRIKKL